MTQRPMLQMQEMADQLVALATHWEPEGMLEVLDAYRHLPDVLHRIAQAWQIFYRKAAERYPLAPVVVELIEAVYRHQEMTAVAAEEVAPTARALHAREIEALADPRNAMWDVRANRHLIGESVPRPQPVVEKPQPTAQQAEA